MYVCLSVCPHFSPKLCKMDPTNHIYSERAWSKDGFCDIKNMGHFVTKIVYIGDAHPYPLYSLLWI